MPSQIFRPRVCMIASAKEADMLSNLWLTVQFLLGRLLNGLGLPGWVARGTYSAYVTHAIVHVRVGPLFTVVTVNGLDIYFHRLTGKIDGVGFSPGARCIPGSTLESAHFGELPGNPPPPAHRR